MPIEFSMYLYFIVGLTRVVHSYSSLRKPSPASCELIDYADVTFYLSVYKC